MHSVLALTMGSALMVAQPAPIDSVTWLPLYSDAGSRLKAGSSIPTRRALQRTCMSEFWRARLTGGSAGPILVATIPIECVPSIQAADGVRWQNSKGDMSNPEPGAPTHSSAIPQPQGGRLGPPHPPKAPPGICEPDPEPREYVGLTQREAEVVRMKAAGMSVAEIADALSLRPRTIDKHLHAAHHKVRSPGISGGGGNSV